MKVLLAEGNSESSRAIATELARNGYEVVETGDGLEALKLVRGQTPELALLDITLPGLDGLTLCRILRAEFSIPILLLTSRRDSVDLIGALDCGAEDCLVKPFAPGELAARLQVVLKRRGKMLIPKLQAGDLTLDLMARRAFRRDSVLDLSRKEFDLLAEFIQHPGTVLRRETLITRIWGDTPKTRTLDTHVYWLREKIEDNPTHPQRILTVRGIGYRFDG